MGLGLQWALSTLLFLLAGWWLDGKLGTTPVLLIVGAFVGGTAGFYSLYRHVVSESRQTANEEDR
jgi:F0F1-type ATP synthase assembly protein I